MERGGRQGKNPNATKREPAHVAFWFFRSHDLRRLLTKTLASRAPYFTCAAESITGVEHYTFN